MTPYQLFLVVVLFTWPIIIGLLLMIMGRLEDYVRRIDAPTPEEAGLEPVAGTSEEREIQIVFDGKVVGEGS